MVAFRAYARYLKTLLWHKTCILFIGCWVNWRLRGTAARISFRRLLFHDWVKFLPCEFLPYARYYSFDQYSEVPKEICDEYAAAYGHHYKAMDHHWEYHVENYNPSMPMEQIKLNARPMPVEAVIETAVDSLSAQYSYGGHWPPPDWVRLRDLFSKCHTIHPASLALLCGVWHFLGFSHPLLSIQRDHLYGWPAGALIVASHAPAEALYSSLRAADQLSRVPLTATLKYLLWLIGNLSIYFGIPCTLIAFLCSPSAARKFILLQVTSWITHQRL